MRRDERENFISNGVSLQQDFIVKIEGFRAKFESEFLRYTRAVRGKLCSVAVGDCLVLRASSLSVAHGQRGDDHDPGAVNSNEMILAVVF
jgi:hypothetical protein